MVKKTELKGRCISF